MLFWQNLKTHMMSSNVFMSVPSLETVEPVLWKIITKCSEMGQPKPNSTLLSLLEFSFCWHFRIVYFFIIIFQVHFHEFNSIHLAGGIDEKAQGSVGFKKERRKYERHRKKK